MLRRSTVRSSPPVHATPWDTSQSPRRLQALGNTVGHNLGSAPATVAVSGFSCHPNAVREMALDPAPIRARPHYVSADGSQHLYYSDQVVGGSWLVDSDTTESTGYIASIESSATYPPPGAHTEWVEDCTGGPVPAPVGDDSCRYSRDNECDDGSTGLPQYCLAGTDTSDCGSPGPNSCRYSHDGECDDGSYGGTAYCTAGTDSEDCSDRSRVAATLTLVEDLTAANCVSLASETLETPECAVGAALGGDCSFACAFIYLNSADRCEMAGQIGAFEPSFKSACESAVTAALAAAPDSLLVSGLTCRGLENAQFTKGQQLLRNRPTYHTADGQNHIHWTDDDSKWLFDTNTDDSGYYAYIVPSSAALEIGSPPAGPAVHVRQAPAFACSDDSIWADGTVSIVERLSATNCESLASELLGSPACSDATIPEGKGLEATCSAACAELWLPALQRCMDSRQRASFEGTGGRAALTLACQTAAAGVLATAPSSVVIDGLRYHPRANTVYFLQPYSRHGRPQFASDDAAHHLSWSSVSPTGSSAVWQINGIETEIDSPADELPLGSAVWQEESQEHAAYENSRITLTANYAADWCITAVLGLAPLLNRVCCREEDGPQCGLDGEPPSACSVDCAHLWKPYAERCLDQTLALPPNLARFFNVDCTAVAETLDVLAPQTVSLEESSTYDFYFEGTSGHRYEVTVRTVAGAGGHALCATNAYEDPTTDPSTTCAAILASGATDCGDGDNSCRYAGDGECDDGSAGVAYCSAGTDSADCGFGPTGIYRHLCDAACGFMCEQLGIQDTVLFVLPPGGSDSAHAIVINTISSADKAVGFTAASTGKFAVRVRAHQGAGEITVNVENVGTALHRSPPLRGTLAPKLR